jgi:uncharacterized protein (DUF1697 family)
VARQIVLLRGINIGPRNRVSMPALRELLEEAGFCEVRTYLQSGNVVLTSAKRPERIASECERLIADAFGLEIAVVARTRAQLGAVVRKNPLRQVAKDPKRYQVTFLASPLAAETRSKLQDAVAQAEELVIAGREVYAWHPAGVARSRLWTLLASKTLGVTATSRNWTTVETLLELSA